MILSTFCKTIDFLNTMFPNRTVFMLNDERKYGYSTRIPRPSGNYEAMYYNSSMDIPYPVICTRLPYRYYDIFLTVNDIYQSLEKEPFFRDSANSCEACIIIDESIFIVNSIEVSDYEDGIIIHVDKTTNYKKDFLEDTFGNIKCIESLSLFKNIANDGTLFILEDQHTVQIHYKDGEGIGAILYNIKNIKIVKSKEDFSMTCDNCNRNNTLLLSNSLTYELITCADDGNIHISIIR